ncbi:hypothetical protein P7D63_20425 [Enterococcus raffinosus]|uniref:hypothetical protein n=1 Tax=Enterococcus raffinosus TaxID=71452 RepID=UPI0028924D67|nr:hypothetical protein [Enterococcus raffinosus]MDT2557053.1 hypothetical protein [Enterococcus raffinosus]
MNDNTEEQIIFSFLDMIISGENLGAYDYSLREIQCFKLAKTLGYVSDFDVEKSFINNQVGLVYYVMPKSETDIELTEKGYQFYTQFREGEQKMNYEQEQQYLKEVLSKLKEAGSIQFSDFNMSSSEYCRVMETALENEYVSGVNISGSSGRGGIVHDKEARLTTKGNSFLDSKTQTNPGTTNITFNAPAEFHGSALGSGNTITNSFNSSLSELKEFIAGELSGEDQATANEIVEIIETKEIKPGIFTRFAGLFDKHPGLVKSVGSAVAWVLTNPDKLPFN